VSTGVYSRLKRQDPLPKGSNRILNTAILYSSYRVMLDFLPKRRDIWRQMLIDVDLDPDDDHTEPDGPIGIGNAAGFAVAAGRRYDGMNQVRPCIVGCARTECIRLLLARLDRSFGAPMWVLSADGVGNHASTCLASAQGCLCPRWVENTIIYKTLAVCCRMARVCASTTL
jgi:hypothetical protein